jgi:hypothetical protein
MAPPSIQDQIFNKLQISLEGQKAQAAFCCGGSSKIDDNLRKADVKYNGAPPVILHWAGGNEQDVRKLVFSQDTSKSDEFKTQIQELTEACQPATFGRGGNEVTDGMSLPFVRECLRL